MVGMVDGEDGYHTLHQDLGQLGKFTEEWLMDFNADKYEVVHFDKSILGGSFRGNGRTLESL